MQLQKPDLSKLPREELEKLASYTVNSDLLFRYDFARDFEPTIEDVINHIDIHGEDYRIPHGAKEKLSLSVHSDRLAELKTFASNHDLSVSAAADLLFRVALGDYAEWWHHNAPEKKAEGK